MKVEDLNRLFEGKKIKLGEFELNVKKLGTDDLPVVAEYMDIVQEEKGKFTPRVAELIRKIVVLTLRRSVEDATDESKLELPVEYTMPLFDAIMEVNKKAFGEATKDDKKILEDIKNRQEGLIKK